MFTTPSFLSTFYACAIALNTQLVFVHNYVPRSNKQILYFIIPPILSLLISTSLGSFFLLSSFRSTYHSRSHSGHRGIWLRRGLQLLLVQHPQRLHGDGIPPYHPYMEPLVIYCRLLSHRRGHDDYVFALQQEGSTF